MSDTNPIELALKAQAWSILEKGLYDPKMPAAANALRHCMKSSMKAARKVMSKALVEASNDFEGVDLSDAVAFAKQAGINLEL